MATLTSKYQATVPRQVREVLQLGAGDRIEYLLERGGGVRVRKASAPASELQALEATLAPEWDSPGDDDAYGEL